MCIFIVSRQILDTCKLETVEFHFVKPSKIATLQFKIFKVIFGLFENNIFRKWKKTLYDNDKTQEHIRKNSNDSSNKFVYTDDYGKKMAIIL